MAMNLSPLSAVSVRIDTATENVSRNVNSCNNNNNSVSYQFSDADVITNTRNTLDCDQSNAYSSRVVSSAISQDLLFRSFSLYRRSATDPPL